MCVDSEVECSKDISDWIDALETNNTFNLKNIQLGFGLLKTIYHAN